jgi:hypothetical protein
MHDCPDQPGVALTSNEYEGMPQQSDGVGSQGASARLCGCSKCCWRGALLVLLLLLTEMPHSTKLPGKHLYTHAHNTG